MSAPPAPPALPPTKTRSTPFTRRFGFLNPMRKNLKSVQCKQFTTQAACQMDTPSPNAPFKKCYWKPTTNQCANRAHQKRRSYYKRSGMTGPRYTGTSKRSTSTRGPAIKVRLRHKSAQNVGKMTIPELTSAIQTDVRAKGYSSRQCSLGSKSKAQLINIYTGKTMCRITGTGPYRKSTKRKRKRSTKRRSRKKRSTKRKYRKKRSTKRRSRKKRSTKRRKKRSTKRKRYSRKRKRSTKRKRTRKRKRSSKRRKGSEYQRRKRRAKTLKCHGYSVRSPATLRQWENQGWCPSRR